MVSYDRYPKDVVGLVLVDASHPDQWAHIPASMDGQLTGLTTRVLSNLATLGFLRLYDPLTPQVATGLPANAYSTNSVHRTVDGATHEDLISNPEHAALVADTIRQLVASAAR